MEKKRLGDRLGRPSERPTNPEEIKTTNPVPASESAAEREPGLRVWSASYEKRFKPDRKKEDELFHDLDDQGRCGTFLVADGVGGSPAGEIAADIVRSRVKTENSQLRALQWMRRDRNQDVVDDEEGDAILEEDLLKQALEAADQDMRVRGTLEPEKQGMASTATLARLIERPSDGRRELVFANCGDSRLMTVQIDGYAKTHTLDAHPYLLYIQGLMKGERGRQYALQVQTLLDQFESYEQFMRLYAQWSDIEAEHVDRGLFQMLKPNLDPHMTRAYFERRQNVEYVLGHYATIETGRVPLAAGTKIVLVTDGVTRNLYTDEIGAIIAERFDMVMDEEVRNAAQSAGRPADALIWAARARADQRGINPRATEDDMTVIVVE